MVPNFGFATGSSSVAAENDADRMYRVSLERDRDHLRLFLVTGNHLQWKGITVG
jgi:hypothetical protein